MNAFKLLTYSLAVLSASSAYAQHTVFATSGQGRGAATDARQQAQIDALTNRPQSIKSNGTVQLQDAGTCDPAAEGTMKYDSGADTVVYCDGTDWQTFGGAGGSRFTVMGGSSVTCPAGSKLVAAGCSYSGSGAPPNFTSRPDGTNGWRCSATYGVSTTARAICEN